MELSHFASYLVLDEEKKVEKFEHGLDHRIKECIHAFRICKFSKLVNQAAIVEEDIQESIEYNN